MNPVAVTVMVGFVLGLPVLAASLAAYGSLAGLAVLGLGVAAAFLSIPLVRRWSGDRGSLGWPRRTRITVAAICGALGMMLAAVLVRYLGPT